MSTSKFDKTEIKALERLFRRFEDSNGAEGIDPTKTGKKHSAHKAYRAILKEEFLKDPILGAWVNENDNNRLNEKIFRNYTTNAEKFVRENRNSATITNNTKPTAAARTRSTATLSNPTNSPPPKVAQFDTPVVPTTPALPKAVMSFNYEDNLRRFDAKYNVFQWTEELGDGSFGIVYKAAVKKQGNGEVEYVAIKRPHKVYGKERMALAHQNVTEALSEIEIWRVLSHEGSPYILGLLDYFVVKDDRGLPQLLTVSPYMEDGTLEEYIEFKPNGEVRLGGLPLQESAIFAKQYFLAAAHMNEKQIVSSPRTTRSSFFSFYTVPTDSSL